MLIETLIMEITDILCSDLIDPLGPWILFVP